MVGAAHIMLTNDRDGSFFPVLGPFQKSPLRNTYHNNINEILEIWSEPMCNFCRTSYTYRKKSYHQHKN